MSDTQTQYISKEKRVELEQELKHLKEEKIPNLAKRIDDARQLGDLSENAEYHAAREEMAWTQSRVKEIDQILNNSELFKPAQIGKNIITIGTSITVKINGKQKTYMIVGAHEAEPLIGKISNESPLGQAFLGHHIGDKVQVTVPAGVQVYEIVDIT